MIIGSGTARGGNGRTASLSDCRRTPADAAGASGLVRKKSGEAARSRGSRQLIVANRVKSPDTAANPVLLNLNMAGMNVCNGLLLVGVLPQFM
jgi:hypothetical protein